MSPGQPQQLLVALRKAERLRNLTNRTGSRIYTRFDVRGEAELHPMDARRLDRQPLQIVLRDVSRGGVGFVADEPLDINSTWRICFLNRGHVVAQQAMIVRHCRSIADGAYLIGAMFCIETGVLSMLGVDPVAAQRADGPRPSDTATFVAPEAA